jgi:thiol-disulfide isomerase/thioredoxin
MRRFCAIAVVALLALSGCGSAPTPSGPAAPPAPTTAGQGGTPGATTGTADGATSGRVVPTVLDFKGTRLDGSLFDGASLAGKPVVLWFWAPWCPTCRGQIGTVTSLGEQYRGTVEFVAVGGLDSADAIRSMSGEIPHVTHVVDAEGLVWRHFRVTEQSTYQLIDADGRVVMDGYLDNDELRSAVDRLAG